MAEASTKKISKERKAVPSAFFLQFASACISGSFLASALFTPLA
jgi:hypothetical protein